MKLNPNTTKGKTEDEEKKEERAKYLCSVCGEGYNNLSLGGLGICSVCDCGYLPISKLKKIYG